MPSSSPDAGRISLRELELFESQQGRVEIAPRWTVRFQPGAALLLDPRGRSLTLNGRLELDALRRLEAGPEHPRGLASAMAESGNDTPEGALKVLRHMVATGVLRVRTSGPAGAPLEQPDFERFKCQLAYFSDFEEAGADSLAIQRRLLAARVAVIGLGGLGSLTAQLLLSAGVRQLKLVDGDAVELSNLPRQFLFSQADLGQPKTEALARRLAAFDGQAQVECVTRFVESEADASQAVADTDFVFLCADAPAVRLAAWIGEACFRSGVPYLAMAGPWIGPIYVPSVSPCYACQSRFNAREIADLPSHFGAFLDQPPAAVRPAFPPGPALTAALFATAGIEFLAGIDRHRLACKRVMADIHGVVREVEMPRYGDCSRCGTA